MSQKWAKITAILALIAIGISVIGTSLLYIIELNAPAKEQTYTKEEYQKMLEEYLKNNSGTISTGTVSSTGSISIGNGENVIKTGTTENKIVLPASWTSSTN